MCKKKAVIFGGSGFLGSYVADDLVSRGVDVTIADITPPVEKKYNQKFKKVNVLNQTQISNVISDTDYVFNFI